MNDSERQEIFDAARDVVLAAVPDAWAVYVYGSFARGEEWPESDLDIAVLLPPNRRIRDLLALLSAVSDCCGSHPDEPGRSVGVRQSCANSFELI
jgi:predicted nucleotidyltransferase